MFVIDIKKKVYKFLKTLDNSETIFSKIEQLKYFKSNQRISLDIERMLNLNKKYFDSGLVK